MTVRELNVYASAVGRLRRQEQELREAGARARDHEDVYRTYTCAQAGCEAERCLQCDLRVPIRKVENFNAYSKR